MIPRSDPVDSIAASWCRPIRIKENAMIDNLESIFNEAMSLAEALEDEAAYFPSNSRLMYRSAMMLRLLALKGSGEDDIAADE